MKKSILCSSLLAALLLVGCGQAEKPNTDPKPEDKPTTQPEVKPDTQPEQKPETKPEVTPVGTLVAEYDLSGINGVYNADPALNTVYFAPKGESKDVVSEFTNKVTDSAVQFASVMTGTTGCERAQLTQGPKVGGIKLNGKHADSKLTFNFVAGQSVDQIIIEFAIWKNTATEDATYKINDAEYQIPASEHPTFTLSHAQDDMTSVTVHCTKGRPVITSIKFYNK